MKLSSSKQIINLQKSSKYTHLYFNFYSYKNERNREAISTQINLRLCT